MRHIGKPVPIFRTPALVDGQLTYFGPAQFIGRWIAVYFLPYAGIVKPNFLGHDADCLDQIDTTLLFVSSGTNPLHRIWLEHPTTSRTPLLYDPLSRRCRAFRVGLTQTPVRCQTFLIDCAGLLRFHLTQDFTDRGLAALQEILTLKQLHDSGKEPAARWEHHATHEVLMASSENLLNEGYGIENGSMHVSPLQLKCIVSPIDEPSKTIEHGPLTPKRQHHGRDHVSQRASEANLCGWGTRHFTYGPITLHF
ncbi:MAG: hypothetical protein CAF41_011185 [Nitrospira sp. CG24A]|nr:MAG: hypothetical protein CAF41_011185 [Nitrospira sp. CG24A]